MRGWPVVTSIALVEWLRRHRSPAADRQTQLDGRTRELGEARKPLAEALEQQTATSEVLRVISSTPGELEPVFEAMLVNAVRLCEAKFGNLYLYEEGALRIVASHNVPPAFAAARRSGPFHPPPGGSLSEVIRTKQTVHLADSVATQAYAERHPVVVDAVELGGVRTSVAVPMLKDNELIGIIVIFRQEVRPFTDKQVALLTSFASQAVIAIENTRLLNELRERTDDLSESLEQQTATSDVLQIISSSPGELEPVFQAMLANATRICEAVFGNLYLCDGDAFRMVAAHNDPPRLRRGAHPRSAVATTTRRRTVAPRNHQESGPGRRGQDAAVPEPSIHGRWRGRRLSDRSRDSAAQGR